MFEKIAFYHSNMNRLRRQTHMYLKRIESYGFKSFANRVSIEFDLGMNAIVGPNGSGKSNVVDAVRWVLGEQSAKALRGGAMQDVIFKGSATKKQLGFAEVTLVLDNEDKQLSVAYDEVSITRRLYRSGESNYLINGQKVRLQDITNLFMDSGIGKESFSIIGQGKIDEILNSKPIERRAIFEETAGVLKYKTRKEQSLRRLEKTHANLLRVVDVMKELEHQIKPLERQSKVAQQYLEFKDELSSLEVSLLAFEINQLNDEHKELQRESETLTLQIAEQTIIVDKSTQALEELEVIVKASDELIEEYQEKLLLITQEAASAKSAQEIQEQKKTHLQERIEQIEQDIESLSEKITQVDALEKQGSTINFDEKISRAKYEEGQAREQLKTELGEIENLKEEQLQAVKMLQAITSRYETLGEISDSLQNLFQGVREVIKASKNNRVQGIHGTVLDLIEVDPNYVKAIEVSFANALQFVVTDNQRSAENAISYLKQQRLGKATFLPLDVIRGTKVAPQQLQEIQNMPGFVGVASDLVTYDAAYEKIILQLLGQTIVAKTLSDANALARKLQFRFRIVTLNGETVHRGGSLTGGESRNERAGLLLQKQELKELATSKEREEKALKLLSDTLYDKMDLSKATEQQLLALQEKTRNIEQQQQLFAHQLDQMLSQKKDLRQQIEQFLERKNTYEHELSVLHSASQTLVDSTLAFDEQKEEILKEINAKRSERLKQEQEKSDLVSTQRAAEGQEKQLQRVAQQNELKQNTAQIKIHDKITRLQETYNESYENLAEVEMTGPYEEVGTRVKELRTSIDKMGMVNLGAIEEYERVSERYDYLVDQKYDLDEAEENLLEIISSMDVEMEERFEKTFKEIQEHFQETFRLMFGGGSAELRLEEKGNYLESGIEIFTQPPGKKNQNLTLLSGGERALTAIALLFAILRTKPVPFCILDEVEAALDEANVDRFAKYVKDFSRETQFIVVTHRKGTMEEADVLYGVTMEEAGISKILSVRLQDADSYLDA